MPFYFQFFDVKTTFFILPNKTSNSIRRLVFSVKEFYEEIFTTKMACVCSECVDIGQLLVATYQPPWTLKKRKIE